MNQSTPTRRRFLQGATTVAAALLVPRPANAAPTSRPTAALQENRIEGSNLTMLALPGAASVLLTHLVRRYLYEIDHTVTQHELVSGNGTAIAIRPAWYPTGVSGGYCQRDTVVLRDILADFNGVVRWGGDRRPANESSFQIDDVLSNPALDRIAAQIATWNHTPGLGAGALVDPTVPTRRRRALALAAQQRR
jgi:hypothetical protein